VHRSPTHGAGERDTPGTGRSFSRGLRR
jgi:hypothetical protein